MSTLAKQGLCVKVMSKSIEQLPWEATVFFIINYFKKRQAALVFLITFLIYTPVLFNHYAGDDSVIIGRNTFYKSWQNIPRVFGKGCISDIRQIAFNSDPQLDFGTGRDSYRPISNLTYFFDYYLFQARPWGSHLINILIHGVNAVLVYGIVNQIFASSFLGVFAGLLFSLHPIQSEAVAVMSYRRDILAAMFVLYSFYFWIKFKQGGYVRKKYYYGSLTMCFLALFSKESALMLPFVILLSDQILAPPFKAKRDLLYGVYPDLYFLSISIFLYFSKCLYFFLKRPSFFPLVRRFFLLWYLIFYLPISNLIPLSNPMANRYMYLPSIGLLIVSAIYLNKIFRSAFLKKHS